MGIAPEEEGAGVWRGPVLTGLSRALGEAQQDLFPTLGSVDVRDSGASASAQFSLDGGATPVEVRYELLPCTPSALDCRICQGKGGAFRPRLSNAEAEYVQAAAAAGIMLEAIRSESAKLFIGLKDVVARAMARHGWILTAELTYKAGILVAEAQSGGPTDGSLASRKDLARLLEQRRDMASAARTYGELIAALNHPAAALCLTWHFLGRPDVFTAWQLLARCLMTAGKMREAAESFWHGYVHLEAFPSSMSEFESAAGAGPKLRHRMLAFLDGVYACCSDDPALEKRKDAAFQHLVAGVHALVGLDTACRDARIEFTRPVAVRRVAADPRETPARWVFTAARGRDVVYSIGAEEPGAAVEVVSHKQVRRRAAKMYADVKSLDELLSSMKAGKQGERASGRTCSCCVCGLHPGALKRCKGCQAVWYCSPECQKKDWKNHKPVCKLVTATPE